MVKARILDIKRFAVHDGDGIRTTVFLKGCTLKCLWCHNPEGISYTPQLAYYPHKCIGCGECAQICPNGAQKIENGCHVFDRNLCIACGICESACLGSALKYYGKEMSTEELVPLLLEDKIFYEHSGGGITLSGGEALAHPDFCEELLKRMKEKSINTAVDTCGNVPQENFEKVLPYTDTFLYDVKAFDTDIHKKCTGCGNELILSNLEFLESKGARIEIRIPFVPEYNSDQIGKIAEYLNSFENIVRVRVLPYHNFAGSKYDSLGIPNTLPVVLPTDEQIEVASKQFKVNSKY